ncbi:hypothetical protein MKW92_021492 [Papaver armeniacum]|nr:hypothetical protein MKW92_021492 [Papaver armeniacum]
MVKDARIEAYPVFIPNLGCPKSSYGLTFEPRMEGHPKQQRPKASGNKPVMNE